MTHPTNMLGVVKIYQRFLTRYPLLTQAVQAGKEHTYTAFLKYQKFFYYYTYINSYLHF